MRRKRKFYATKGDALAVARGLWAAGYVVDVVKRSRKKFEVKTPKSAYCADGIPLHVGSVVCFYEHIFTVVRIVDFGRCTKKVLGDRFLVIYIDNQGGLQSGMNLSNFSVFSHKGCDEHECHS